nr:hypothetical protein [Tanacetum cinerariifolium]
HLHQTEVTRQFVKVEDI